LRREDFEGVTRLEPVDDASGEEAVLDPADPDAWWCAGGCADRVGAAFLGAVDLLAEGEVLAGPEGEGVGEVRWHVEGDGDRVRAEPVDAGDR
jgi:hypothetical protein